MRKSTLLVFSALGLGFAGWANATAITTQLSPSGYDITQAGASARGGLVLELEGNNGSRIVAQLSSLDLVSAAGLSGGYALTEPFSLGTISGIDISVFGSMGLKSASVLLTVYDAQSDSYPGLRLLADGNLFGNLAGTKTQGYSNTDPNLTDATNFRGGYWDAGWISTASLNGLLNQLADGTIQFQLEDATADIRDNQMFFYDQSYEGKHLAPTVVPPAVPEPATLGLILAGMLGLSSLRRRC